MIGSARAARASGHGPAWGSLLTHEGQVRVWVNADLHLANVHGGLPAWAWSCHRTLHQFASERCVRVVTWNGPATKWGPNHLTIRKCGFERRKFARHLHQAGAN